MNKFTGTLLYVSINQPVNAYVKPGEDPKPKEWKASVALTDEDTVDAFEEYAKSIGANPSIKKVKATEFTAKYKAEVPEGAGKNIWVLTFRKSTELGKTGKPVPELYKPKVLERQGRTLLDVTNSKLPANGSIGTISTDLFKRTDGSHNIFLKNVLVTDLIEYEGGSNYVPGDEFDDDVDGDDTPAETPAPKAAAPKVAKVRTKPPADAAADSEDPPF